MKKNKMNARKKWIWIVCICAVVLVIMLALCAVLELRSRRDESVDHHEGSTAATDAVSTDGTVQGAEQIDEQTPDTTVKTAINDLVISPDETTAEGNGGSSAQTQKPTKPNQNQSAPQNAAISFPYQIPGTSLTIQKVGGYSGIFLEDGSDAEISDVAALVLVNNGTVGVEYAEIQMNCSGTVLTFKATSLPAGGMMMVQELNAATLPSGGVYSDCTASVAALEKFEMSESQVSVTENEDGSLTVTNLTDKKIPCVRVFYKFYMADEDAYVGGITYTVKIVNLEAGTSQTVKPSHYLAGSSQIMMVRTYDSAE